MQTWISPQWSGPSQREQARFERDESRGVVRAHRAARHAAGVGIKSARHVEREHGHAEPVDRIDERRVAAGQVALQADAEQAVDTRSQRPIGRQASPASCRRRRARHRSGACIGRQLRGIAGEHHVDVVPPWLRVPRDDERIAAVVARARQSPTPRPRLGADSCARFRAAARPARSISGGDGCAGERFALRSRATRRCDRRAAKRE